jgi:hypothetical protein
MILDDKAKRWNGDKEIQGLLKQINMEDAAMSRLTKKFSAGNAKSLLAAPLDRVKLAEARPAVREAGSADDGIADGREMSAQGGSGGDERI